MFRGVIHFHSTSSYDSLFTKRSILKIVKDNQLNFLILTDHNSLKGSLDLKRMSKKQNLDLEIPLAAEYKTEYGDIIAAFINKDITDMSFENFVKEVRNQGGIILFPHPYKNHEKIDIIAKEADLIEVFNGRLDNQENEKASELAKKYNKNIYYSSDAHCSKDFLKVIVAFKNYNNNLKESILRSDISYIKLEKSNSNSIYISQIIKSLRILNIKLFLYSIKYLILNLIKK